MNKHTISFLAFAIALVSVFTACKKDQNVAVKGIALNKLSATLNIQDTLTITPTVLPTNATNKTVMWTSSDTTVATVNNGIVIAMGEGAATITAITEDGHKTATCPIITGNIHPVLGEVSFATDSTWVVGDQEWSDAVQTTVCSGKTDFKGVNKTSSEWIYLADCRSNPGQKGDLFSWQMVNDYRDFLCPDGWRVPTSDDFVNLDKGLGGTGGAREGNPEINEFIHTNYLNPERWGGELSGYVDVERGLQYPGEEVYYWSQTEQSNDLAHYLNLFDKGIVLGTWAYTTKSNGHTLRCVRNYNTNNSINK